MSNYNIQIRNYTIEIVKYATQMRPNQILQRLTCHKITVLCYGNDVLLFFLKFNVTFIHCLSSNKLQNKIL